MEEYNIVMNWSTPIQKLIFLSFFLSVVYEHRSRLEKSLQKERLEHKKAKEGKCVYNIMTTSVTN